MDKGLSKVSMLKRFFYKMFKKAWDISFIEENIQSVFRSLGIWSVDGKEIIAKVSKPSAVFNPKPIGPSTTPKTPLNSRAIRRARIALCRSPYTKKIDYIFKSARVLAA
jgi:hypothetical protein